MTRQDLRNRIGSVTVGVPGSYSLPDGVVDNLAIALCSYFDCDPRKPDEEEGENGWTPWVIAQTNATIDAIVDIAMEHRYG